MPESRASYTARMLVGVLLLLESAALFVLASFTAIIGGLTGLLAFGFGAGSSTDEQIAQGFAMIAVTIIAPFVGTVLLLLAGVLLLFRRGKAVIIAAGMAALAAQAVFHVYVEEGFSAGGVVPLALNLASVVTAFACVPRRRARPTV